MGLTRSEKRHRIELAVEGWKRRAVAYVESTSMALLAELLRDEAAITSDTLLSELLEVQIANTLRKNGIYRVGDVRAMTVVDMCSIRGINKATVEHVNDRLEPHGFRVGDCK